MSFVLGRLSRELLSLVAILTLQIFALVPCGAQDAPRMRASIVPGTGQVLLRDGTQAVLQYNFRRVELPPGYLETVPKGGQRYAIPRSNYIHPLHGPDGEVLTVDLDSSAHPHHRGIYWAWPEVGFGGQMGDLHALQKVFARPVGQARLTSGSRAATVEARNLWLWEDDTPIVFERFHLTAHALDERGARAIDLVFTFEALKDGVTLARRGTKLYGGLNTRLAKVEGLKLKRHADADDEVPRRAWSYAAGKWKGGKQVVTMAILEDPRNPDYPGDWITYPDLPWFQPAFPRANTRFELKPGEPLVLRYRFLIVPGVAAPADLHAAWDRYSLLPKSSSPHSSKKGTDR